MKAFIIYQEQATYEALATLLREYGYGVDIISKTKDAKEGKALIQTLKPDLVILETAFLDQSIRFTKEASSFNTLFILVTSEIEHIHLAYESGAIACLPKPVDGLQLVCAVMKVQEFRRLRQIEEQHRLLLDSIKKQENSSICNRRICFSNQQEVTFVALKDLIRIQANGNCSSIYAFGQSNGIFVTKNIGEYIKLFKSIPFLFQTHRSHLVNLYHVRKYIKKDGGVLLVKPHNGNGDVIIQVSDKHREELFQRIEALGVCYYTHI